MRKEFTIYDNIDYEVIEVGKDSLLLKLRECQKYASLPAEIIGYGGIAITLLAAVFLTERTRNLWVVSGNTVQATFLVGGIVAMVLTIKKLIDWYHTRDGHTPEAIVESLSKSKEMKPIALLSAPSQNLALSTNKERVKQQKAIGIVSK